MDTIGHPPQRKYIYWFSSKWPKHKKNEKIEKNLSKGEQKAMEELAKRRDIITTNADKGGAVVIMDKEKYINEAIRKVSDKQNYKLLQEDQKLHYSNLVDNTIHRFKKENLLSNKLAEELKSVNATPHLPPPNF